MRRNHGDARTDEGGGFFAADVRRRHGLLVRTSTVGNLLADLAGKKIAVISGTSNEQALADALEARSIKAVIVTVKTRADGLAELEAGTVDAFASDRVLLIGLATRARDPR